VRFRASPLAALAAGAILLSSCGGSGRGLSLAATEGAVPAGRLEAPVRRWAPQSPSALVADAAKGIERIPVFRKPWSKRPFVVLDNPDVYNVRRVFLVKDLRPDRVQAYLPMRPNGVTGWIPSEDLVIRENEYRITVDLSSNRLAVFEGDRRVMWEPVAAGTGGTPTPTGLFYTTILVQTGDPGSAYGPYIYGLSGYSEVLFSFGGGEGQIGIHGTNNPSLLGQDVSHGCIRMRNEAITKMADLLPLGTPVRIKP
jgi:lipoprotein-anchoring transpeptidase ErfK/SrfK